MTFIQKNMQTLHKEYNTRGVQFSKRVCRTIGGSVLCKRRSSIQYM